MDDYLERILKARVYDVAIETPLEPARRLSARLGRTVLLKREDLQPVFTFKVRGAHNKIAHLDDRALRAGVVCASAGNHAQGVALAAQRRGVPATIVMPITAPSIKVDAVRALGGEVVLHGETYDDAYTHGCALARDTGRVFIHPFDDPDVIAGQGTIGIELLRRQPAPIAAIYLPVGGGGLAAGVAAYVKALYPEIPCLGVEPENAASMTAALRAGHPVTLDRVSTFADGVAVRRVGDVTFRLCRQLLDDVVLVSTDEICAAIRDIFEDTRTIVEPAGALAVAALNKDHQRRTGAGPLIAVNGGANVNFDRLRPIAERADLGAQREALLAVEIPERRGAFREFCSAIGPRHVTEFNYRLGDPARAHIFVGVELKSGAAEKHALIDHLQTLGYLVVDLSDDELAKLHVRHMVGGRGPALQNEHLYRFRFPERRGALLDFLDALGGRWNISLFHYRHDGTDAGHVLAGIEVPPAEEPDLAARLARLAFLYCDETGNPAYRLFLAAP